MKPATKAAGKASPAAARSTGKVGARVTEKTEKVKAAAVAAKAAAKAQEPAAAPEPANKFHPTLAQEKMVIAMAAYGIPQEEICKVIGITKPTLHKHFRDRLDAGMAEANAKVAESLFKMAISGKHVAAAIYWTKARMGWRDVQAVQQLDANGNPITPGTTFVLKMER